MFESVKQWESWSSRCGSSLVFVGKLVQTLELKLRDCALTVSPSKLGHGVYEALVKLRGPSQARLGIGWTQGHHVASVHGLSNPVGWGQFVMRVHGGLCPILIRPGTRNPRIHIFGLHLKHREDRSERLSACVALDPTAPFAKPSRLSSTHNARGST